MDVRVIRGGVCRSAQSRGKATYGLDGLDLSVARREVHGFLGPNGAGKSTTIRVLPALLKADAGQLRVLDGDPRWPGPHPAERGVDARIVRERLQELQHTVTDLIGRYDLEGDGVLAHVVQGAAFEVNSRAEIEPAELP